MAIYEINENEISKIAETTFSDVGIKERQDLQRLLREHIEIVSPETLVIYEEFGEWEDSRRRIDLLGIGTNGDIVVIELKRTEDGGHMELQAVRYAAMVSTMTFEQAVEIYSKHLNKHGSDLDARTSLLEFLDWQEPDEDSFGQDVKMVLVSAEFSKELTTAVMWLNERELDIRCIRMKPYSDNGRVLVDVQQVIPLPESEEYQVKIREKGMKERKDRAERYDIRKRFWSQLLDYALTKTDLHANISPSESSNIQTGAGMRGLGFKYVVQKHSAIVELFIDRGTGREEENMQIFESFLSKKEQIEDTFGQPLNWQRRDHQRACRIQTDIESGYKDDESQWQKTIEVMVAAMVRLESAMKPHITALKSKG